MRAWFMVAALLLGLIGVWGEQGRGTRGVRTIDGGSGTVSAMDDPGPAPTPKAP